MSYWRTPNEDEKYAIAVANFESRDAAELSLTVGEPIDVTSVSEYWCYGKSRLSTTSSNVQVNAAHSSTSAPKGIFPRSFVHFSAQSTSSSALFESTDELLVVEGGGRDELLLEKEITQSLRLWWARVKKLYVESNLTDQGNIMRIMLKLSAWNEEIRSKSLPKEQLKTKRWEVAKKIDLINSKLKLDMKVRDERGHPLVIERLPPILLYRKHLETANRNGIEAGFSKGVIEMMDNDGSGGGGGGGGRYGTISSSLSSVPSSMTDLMASYSLWFSLTNVQVLSRFRGDCEITATLYKETVDAMDTKRVQFLPFSENFSVVWPTGSSATTTTKNPQTHKEHCANSLFTDLGQSDLSEPHRIYLVCRIGRICPLEGKDSTLKAKKGSPAHTGNGTYARQPYGYAVIDLTDSFRKTLGLGRDHRGHRRLNSSTSEPSNRFMPIVILEDGNYDATIRRALLALSTNTTGLSSTISGSTGNSSIGNAGVGNAGTHSGKGSLLDPNRKLGDIDAARQILKDVAYGSTLSHHDGTQGLWLSYQVLQGTKDEVKKSNPALFAGSHTPSVVRKMGFPEVIVEGDVRSDLYLTLISGEFAHKTGGEKNIEVKACLADEKGKVVPGSVVTINEGERSIREDYYQSMVHYHQDKPKWAETIKISLPERMDQNSNLHIRFTFKHRSSNETKDKAERPFALAWMRLIQDNRTIVKDGNHDLLVYKIDKKTWDESDASYKSLPCARGEFERSNSGSKLNLQVAGYNLNPKDSFSVRTLTCSTGLTQSYELLGLLDWKNEHRNLKQSLAYIMGQEGDSKSGEEVVKFLPHILDVLFEIVTSNSEHDMLVFDTLVYVIKLVGETRYKTFRKVMDDYLESEMNSALAYMKLIPILRTYIERVNVDHKKPYKALQSLEYLMRFIVRSRMLYLELHPDAKMEDYANLIGELLESMVVLMNKSEAEGGKGSLLCQGALLKFLPVTVPLFAYGMHKRQLTEYVVRILNAVPGQTLLSYRLTCCKELVDGELFVNPHCRQVLLPVILKQIQNTLDDLIYTNSAESRTEIPLCASVIEQILDQLYSEDEKCDPKPLDMKLIMSYVLRSVIQTVIRMKFQPYYVAVLLGLLIRVDSDLWEDHINSYENTYDLFDFTTEILDLFQDLVQNVPFYTDWSEMIGTMNNTILKIICFLSTSITNRFAGQEFSQQLWNSYFLTVVAYVKQEHLMSQSKSLLGRYGDMRKTAAQKLRSMWFSLNLVQKNGFIPELVGPFLEVCLIEEKSLRDATIPIFFDMISTEYLNRGSSLGRATALDPQVKARVKLRENKLEKELITELDRKIVMERKGSLDFAEQFIKGLEEYSSSNSNDAKDEASRLIKTLQVQLKHLLEMKETNSSGAGAAGSGSTNPYNIMICTLNLLNFYLSIDQDALHMMYVYNLYDLQKNAENFIEAGFALKLHADKLEWRDNPLDSYLQRFIGHRKVTMNTNRELKDHILREIITLFDQGNYWEGAIEICKELQCQYEEQTFEYDKLASMHTKMSTMYGKITQNLRLECGYFRVGFYGKGFPPYLANKVMIFRGNDLEKLGDFNQKLLSVYPNAKLSQTLDALSEDLKNSDQMVLQINSVKPIDDTSAVRFKNRKVNKKVQWFYKNNEVQKFEMSRRIKRDDVPKRSADNDFVNLWIQRTILCTSQKLPGLLKWFPVTGENTYWVSPLEIAIETVTEANNALKDMMESHSGLKTHKIGVNLSLEPLKQKIIGIVDAAVQGGIANYEKAFLNDEFLRDCSEEDAKRVDELKDAIASQIPILEACVYIHAQKADETDREFHNHIVKKFLEKKKNVEEKYGKRESMSKAVSLEMPRAKKSLPSGVPSYRSSDGFSTIGGGRTSMNSSYQSSGTLNETTSPARSLVGIGFRSPLSSYAAGRENNKSKLNRAKSHQGSRETQYLDDGNGKRSSNISVGSSQSNGSGGPNAVNHVANNHGAGNNNNNYAQPIALAENHQTRRPRRPDPVSSSMNANNSNSKSNLSVSATATANGNHHHSASQLSIASSVQSSDSIASSNNSNNKHQHSGSLLIPSAAEGGGNLESRSPTISCPSPGLTLNAATAAAANNNDNNNGETPAHDDDDDEPPPLPPRLPPPPPTAASSSASAAAVPPQPSAAAGLPPSIETLIGAVQPPPHHVPISPSASPSPNSAIIERNEEPPEKPPLPTSLIGSSVTGGKPLPPTPAPKKLTGEELMNMLQKRRENIENSATAATIDEDEN